MTNINNVELKTYEEIEKVILIFKDVYFLRAITNDEYRSIFINKHIENGHFIAEYHNEKPVGFLSFYSNGEDKSTFVTGFGIIDELGFLKGKTFMRLFKRGIEISKESGMNNLRLEVEKDNDKAIKLYHHLGFEIVHDGNHNSYIMEMPIQD